MVTLTDKACHIPIRLVKNLVVTSAESLGMLVTTPTNHLKTLRGAKLVKPFATKLALLAKSGILNKVLIFTPLGEAAICVTVGKSNIPALIRTGDDDLFSRWMISRSI
jgi:hypothetical protein